MKLIIAIVNKEDEKSLTSGLSKNGFSATKVEGRGGFLGNQNSIFLIGTEEEKVENVIEIIRGCCKTKKENVSPAPQTMEPGELIIPEATKVETSGAIVFVVDISQIFKL